MTKVNLQVTETGSIKCKVENTNGTRYSFSLNTLEELESHQVYDYITHKQYKEVSNVLAGLVAYSTRGIAKGQIDIDKVLYKKTLKNIIIINKRDSFIVGTLVKEGNSVVPFVLSDDRVLNTTNVAILAGRLNEQMEHLVSQDTIRNEVTYKEFQDNRDKYTNLLEGVSENTESTVPDVGGMAPYGATRSDEKIIKRIKLK